MQPKISCDDGESAPSKAPGPHWPIDCRAPGFIAPVTLIDSVTGEKICDAVAANEELSLVLVHKRGEDGELLIDHACNEVVTEVISRDFHVAAPSQPIQGESPVKAARESIGLGLAAEQFSADLFASKASESKWPNP